MNVSALSVGILAFLGFVWFVCEVLKWADAFSGAQTHGRGTRNRDAGTKDSGTDAVPAWKHGPPSLPYAKCSDASRFAGTRLLGDDFELDDDEAGQCGGLWENASRDRARTASGDGGEKQSEAGRPHCAVAHDLYGVSE